MDIDFTAKLATAGYDAHQHVRALQAELAAAYRMVNELRAAAPSPNPTPSFPARALRHWHTPIGLISTIG